MIRNRVFLVSLFMMLLLLSPVAADGEWPVLKGPFFGQRAPRDRAQVFLDGIVSTRDRAEMCAGFARGGREFFFNAKHDGRWTIFITCEKRGSWTAPRPISFTSGFTDRDFTLSPDGNRVYFGSNRPRRRGEEIQESLDLFYSERMSSGTWSEPRNIGPPVNTRFGENYPSVAANGNLYFFSCRGDGMGGCDIYMSRFLGGKYSDPVNLGAAVNSRKNDWDAFIAPDESYIIFSSQDRPDSVGGQDLYVSFRDGAGKWTRAKNMGSRVNSTSCEICPSVSTDDRFFFFTSRRRGKADIFWIKAEVIRSLKPDYLK